jgi:chemotaxis-related protein WspD
MTRSLALTQTDCWNRIGVRGDRSCPELATVVHCHNCPVFAAAGRTFLDAPYPDGYLQEWAQRLAAPREEAATDLKSVLIFRLDEEWLALPVDVLIEVTTPRPIHRVPHRGGLLAGLVNIRGELQMCVRLKQLLGITQRKDAEEEPRKPASAAPTRLLVVQREAERWVFPVDEVAQVYRFPIHELTQVPATLARSAVRFSRGVLVWQGHSVGYLDEAPLFHRLRTSIR